MKNVKKTLKLEEKDFFKIKNIPELVNKEWEFEVEKHEQGSFLKVEKELNRWLRDNLHNDNKHSVFNLKKMFEENREWEEVKLIKIESTDKYMFLLMV